VHHSIVLSLSLLFLQHALQQYRPATDHHAPRRLDDW